MKKQKLSDIAEIFTGVRTDRYNTPAGKQYPVIKKTYSDSTTKVECKFENFTEKLDEKYLSKKDDIIIFLLDPTKVTKLNKEGLVISMPYAVLILNENYDPNFITYLLKSDEFTRELNRLVEGTNMRFMRSSSLKNIKLPIPEYNEQKKIGEFLKLLERKNELYKQTIHLNDKIQKAIMTNTLGGE